MAIKFGILHLGGDSIQDWIDLISTPIGLSLSELLDHALVSRAPHLSTQSHRGQDIFFLLLDNFFRKRHLYV